MGNQPQTGIEKNIESLDDRDKLYGFVNVKI